MLILIFFASDYVKIKNIKYYKLSIKLYTNTKFYVYFKNF